MPGRSSKEIPISKITYNTNQNTWHSYNYKNKKNASFIQRFDQYWKDLVKLMNEQIRPETELRAEELLGGASNLRRASRLRTQANGFRGADFVYGVPKYASGPNKGKRVSYNDLYKYTSFFGSYRPRKAKITKSNVASLAKKLGGRLGGGYVSGFRVKSGIPTLVPSVSAGISLPSIPASYIRRHISMAPREMVIVQPGILPSKLPPAKFAPGPMKSKGGRRAAPYTKNRSKHLRLFPLD